MPGGVEDPLHLLLVAERQRLLDGHAGQPEGLAHPRGQDHVRLPQALHLVDVDVAGQPVAAPPATAPSSARETCS